MHVCDCGGLVGWVLVLRGGEAAVGMNRTSTVGRIDEGRDELNGRVSHVEGSDGRVLLLLGPVLRTLS